MAETAYSATPLVQKLGIRDGFRIAAINPPARYWELLGPLPEGVSVERPASGAGLDLVHLFVRDRRELVPWLRKLRRHIAPHGTIWISWPRRGSRVATNLNRGIVRSLAVRNGLVDTKICNFDEVWSGLKFIARVRKRA